MLDELAAQGRRGDPYYRRLAVSQLRNLYRLMGLDLIESSAGATATPTPTELEPSQARSEVYLRQRIARMQWDGVASGRALLRSLLAGRETEASREVAQLHLELGDWLQWNGEHREASAEYGRAIAALERSGERALLHAWFTQPVELPAHSALRPIADGHIHLGKAPLEAAFKVTGKGLAREVEVLAGEPAVAARLRRYLAGTHFRTRFIAGAGEVVERVSRRYHLVEQVRPRRAVECPAGGAERG